MLMRGIIHMEYAEFLGAEQDDDNDDTNDGYSNLAADLRQGHGAETEHRADDVHQQDSLALREAQIEQAMVQMTLIRLEIGTPPR